MKVLAIFPELHDANPGGIQVSASLAWEALQRETEAHAIFVSSRWQSLRAARAAAFDADIVLFWHLDLLRIAPLLRGAQRRVVFLHGIEAWRRHRFITAMLLRNTNVAANSNYTLQRAAEFNSAIRSATHAIVPLGLGQPRPTTTPLLSPPAAVMIGRLHSGERYKGHHEVIRSWPCVLQRLPDAQLWIVGDGDLRGELEQQVTALQLGSSVRFFGRITDSEKEQLIAAARCLVLPSRGEGFGLVYVEAMRAGRPSLVGPDAGAEVINAPEAGLSVDPADHVALCEALVKLMRLDAAWERMSDAARARYRAHFTAGHFQARLIDALRRLH